MIIKSQMKAFCGHGIENSIVFYVGDLPRTLIDYSSFIAFPAGPFKRKCGDCTAAQHLSHEFKTSRTNLVPFTIRAESLSFIAWKALNSIRFV